MEATLQKNDDKSIVHSVKFPDVPSDDIQIQTKEDTDVDTDKSLSSYYSSEEEEDLKEEEDDKEEGMNSHVTLIPVECHSEREAIKICCICNDVIDQFKLDIDNDEEEEGESGEGKKLDKPLLEGQHAWAEFPQCGCTAHVACFIHSRWVRNNDKKKSVICPRCSEPKTKFSLDEVRSHLSGVNQYKPVIGHGLPTQQMQNKIADSLITLLQNKGRVGDSVLYATKLKTDYTDIWKFIKESGEVKFDDFLSLGWDMSQVYHFITSDFTELCNKYEFNINHLAHEPTAIGLAINYKITASDLKTKFPKDFTLKNLASLDLTPTSMMALGITTHQLCILDMKKDGIKLFEKLNMRDWVKMLNFSKEHLYILGIRKEDFDNPKVLGNNFQEMLKDNTSSYSPKTAEGVLWTIEGLQILLQMTDDELVKYKLAGPDELKNRLKYHGKNKVYYTRRGNNRRRRKSLKERRRKNIAINQSPVDHILGSLEANRDVIIVCPDGRRTEYRRRGRGQQKNRRPVFAPLTDREKRNLAEMESVKECITRT